MKNRKRPSKGRYNFLVEESVYFEFSRLCAEKGMVRSKIIENYMKEFIRSGSSLTPRSVTGGNNHKNIRTLHSKSARLAKPARPAKPVKGRYNFLIDAMTYAEFSRICDEQGLVRSKNLENFMRWFVDENR